MRPILLSTFLLVTSIAFGQKIHEIKTDVVLPFVDIAHLSYEFNPEGRFGVEANVWYSWAEEGNYFVPPTSTFYEDEGIAVPTKQQVLIYTIAGKHYFFKKGNGTGLYLGGYLRQDVRVSHPDDRYDYLVLYTYSSPGENILNKQTLRSALGALAGYKCLIGKRLIVEAGIGIDVDLLQGLESRNAYINWTGIPSLKAGYRF